MTEEHRHLQTPSSFILRFEPLIARGGKVLDLAAGRGRHARLLASRGHEVEAVDRDERALDTLRGDERVRCTVADLEGGAWPYEPGSFDAIVVTNYLHRPLFGTIAASLRDGGVLLYETFMRGQERFRKPTRPEFLLQPNELLMAFRELTVVSFEQGVLASPATAVVQRLCAVKGGQSDALLLPGP
jgi:SAM-dependent methyltransferase